MNMSILFKQEISRKNLIDMYFKFLIKNRKRRKILSKLYFFRIIRRTNFIQNKMIIFKAKGQEIMSLLFRRNLQILLLDTLNDLNRAAYASEIQSSVSTADGAKKPSLGAIVMTLSRLDDKGLISILNPKDKNPKTKNEQRRKYTITLAGKREAEKYHQLSQSLPKNRSSLMPETNNTPVPGSPISNG
ncbi:helix-turn-helix transcriptional regulator [Nitrosomonas aestuarii]|uniref:helix-turn-helix transcriptional regulator n=1 Tax=Nitrosomonas aestuarii TaxID=52441 RepID=UPI000D318ECA|nr:helix-turn-helix transcriptional regulator [Nitrosomonas aestuarii]PTN09696.1 PadR family transcriptional regulator [Nitrosomonas aestuarii]